MPGTEDTRSRRTRIVTTTAAAVWSTAHGALGTWWALGGGGFPFGASTRAVNAGAVLVGLPPRPTGVTIAVLGAFGLLLAAAIRYQVVGRAAGIVAGAGWGTALLLLVPDGRILLNVGEVLLGNLGRLETHVLYQVFCLAGAAVWIATAWALRRPGRRPAWGNWVTYVAIAAPLLYAVPRSLWALGIPVGVVPSDAYGTGGFVQREVAFAAAAGVGAFLTVGLIRPWGRRVPRWLPILGGRRIPRLLAVLPASLAATALISAGLTIWRGCLAMLLGLVPTAPSFTAANWAAWLGNLAWLPWGLALAGATVAYAVRDRRDAQPSQAFRKVAEHVVAPRSKSVAASTEETT